MPYSNGQFEVTNYLGNMIGKKDKFLNSIACMSKEWRLTRGFLEVIKILQKYEEIDKKNPLTDTQLIEMVCELTEKIGQSDWQMDVVSHLSMKIGKSYKSYDAE